MPTEPRFKRVVLKLSGEALQGQREYGIDQSTLMGIAEQIKHVAVGMGEIGRAHV
jgi:uridylate kinase